MRLSRKLVAAAAIMGAVSLLSQGTAYGVGAGAVVVVGTGTINPALTVTTGTHGVSFTGTAAGVFAAAEGTNVAADVGVMDCGFGGSGQDNILIGNGTVNGSCSGAGVFGPATVTCTFHYDRVTAVVVISPTDTTGTNCTVTVHGPNGAVSEQVTAVGVFVFVPTSAPTESYALVGAAAGVGA